MDTNEIDMIKITTGVITELATKFASKLSGKAGKFIKSTVIKSQVDLGIAFEEYLHCAKERCEQVKTLLYPQQPKYLYSIYECIGVMNGDKYIDTKNVNNVTDISHNIIITGTGGMGKTIMMKHFFLNCISNMEYIPVLVELRGINDEKSEDISIFDFIYNSMKTMHFSLEKEYFEYAMEEGCFLILFDGYDEVKNEFCDKVTKQINDMCNQYNDNYYIMSSRPLFEFIGWNNFCELNVMGLSKAQALSLINKLEYDVDIKKKFYQQLDSHLYDKYKTFASNPLLLTIMLITFQSNASIPDKLNDFYEQAFIALFYKHDGTKQAYKRNILSKLEYNDFKKVFSHFCFKSYFASQYEFTESQAIDYIEQAKKKLRLNIDFDSAKYLKDLTNSVCMLIHEGLNYRFSHRSFQEYFAAIYTTTLDDDTQNEMLTQWIKKLGGIHGGDNFCNMLFDLQNERFFKNILKPGLVELKEKFENNNQSYKWIMQHIYSGVSIGQRPQENAFLAVIVNDSYYSDIISLTCDCMGYDYNNYANMNYTTAVNILENMLKTEDDFYGIFSFEELDKKGILDDVMSVLSWTNNQFDFCMKVLEENESMSGIEKKDFKSILDEL